MGLWLSEWVVYTDDDGNVTKVINGTDDDDEDD